MNLDVIPDPLKARPQWVCWRRELREGKETKLPYDPKTGALAKVNDASTWTTFPTASAAHAQYDGLGFVLTADDPFTGIDLDRCLDPTTGRMDPWALTIVDQLQSYTEISPSGEGVRLFVQGTLPPGRHKKGMPLADRHKAEPPGSKKPALEFYDSSRYLTLTGQHLAGTPLTIESRHETLQRVYAAHFPAPSVNGHDPRPAQPVEANDQTLLDKMLHAGNGEKVRTLWRGDWCAYPSQSEADSALCHHLAFWCGRDEARMDRLFRQSGLMRDKWNARRGDTTYGAETVRQACASCRETYGATRVERAVAQLTEEPEADTGPDDLPNDGETQAEEDQPVSKLNCTDAGNGRRFAIQHRESVRWCPQWKAWLTYDGTRWRRDVGNTAVMRLAKRTACRILEEARQTEDDDRRRKLVLWAVTSESVKHLAAMVELAKSEEGIPIEPTELDQDAWLLNCANGTIDLQTGTLLPHDRTQLITKLTAITYDPLAPCPTWIEFLYRILEQDDALIAFMQKAFGYSLTGSVREQVLFLLHGAGANGKSTLIRILLALMGEYGLQTPSETLLISRQDGSVRNDLARLSGARAVAALESDGGRKLAPALVKQLTGNDIVTARFLFSEHFEIVPSWKVWFSTNHRPTVPDDGEALWRRLRLIPFSVQIPESEQDKDLLVKLTHELPGVLAWAVQGCVRWQQQGLGCPAVIEDATADYREDESTFEHFLDEKCVRASGEAVKFSDLRSAYVTWIEDAKDKPMSSKLFAAALIERGFKKTKQHKARCYSGLRLRTDGELAHLQTPVGATQGAADVDFDT